MKQADQREDSREMSRQSWQPEIVGKSPQMVRIADAVARVADTPVNVVIRGESGTGKELIARAIHAGCKRRSGPFVAINCTALPDSLIEAELFGHEPGAFTGAAGMRTGLFESANGGTLFLDEIGSMSAAMQAKLLRVLQERAFVRVGGSDQMRLDVRFIAATNDDLENKIRAGEFREDLYYRIHVFVIELPPLRERKDDIPLLLEYFVSLFCRENQVAQKTFSEDAIDALRSYRWKGNVRELANLVQTVVLTTDNETITQNDLPAYIGSAMQDRGGSSERHPLSLSFDEAVQNFESKLLLDALRSTNGVKSKAAEILQLDKSRLKYLCRKHKI